MFEYIYLFPAGIISPLLRMGGGVGFDLGGGGCFEGVS